MDAGVPIKAPVAGLSIGLVTAEDLERYYPIEQHKLHPSEQAINEQDANAHTSNDGFISNSLSSSSSSDQQPTPSSYALLTDIIGTEGEYISSQSTLPPPTPSTLPPLFQVPILHRAIR